MVVLVGTKNLDGVGKTGALALDIEGGRDHGSCVSGCISQGGHISVGHG